LNKSHKATPPAGHKHGGAEKRLQLIARLSAIFSSSAPLQMQLAEALPLVRRAFDADAGVARSIAGRDLVLLGASGMPDRFRKPRVAVGWGIAEEVFRTLLPIVIPDVRNNPLTESIQHTLPNSYVFGAYAGAPLVADGCPAGILGLYFAGSLQDGEAIDTDFLQTIANILAAAVVKNRLETELRGSEEALESQLRERRVLEVEQVHGQKLESIGRLASEVAHNFNNMLTVMLGFSDLAKSEVGAEHAVQRHLDNISAACRRTEALTRQMLAFARREVIAPTTIRMQRLIRETAQMLVPLLGPRIALEIEILTRTDTVFADASQIEHLLVNLMVNARDAMAGMGTLTVRLDHRTLSERDCAYYHGLIPGNYVSIEVSDTGCGMTEEVRKRIFEPFFTTKVQGKGTGIGLATCYTAVKQNRGDIQVESAPGKGATFRILLPRTERQEEEAETEEDESEREGKLENILLVDSERSIREVAGESLQKYGYRVCVAASGREAYELVVAYAGKFPVVVSDMILPDMSGPELARRIKNLYPEVRMVFTSGCFEVEALTGHSEEDPQAMLRKPFTPERLAGRVRSALNERASGRRGEASN